MVKKIESGWNWAEMLANASRAGVKVTIFKF
jgi:hypothetical protein